MIRVSYQANCCGCGVDDSAYVDGTSVEFDDAFSFKKFEAESEQTLHDLGWIRDANGHWFCEDCRAAVLEKAA